MITPYTSHDEVRAALGVTSDDLDDTTLDLPIYGNHLLMELEDVSLTLVSAYEAAYAAEPQSDLQVRLVAAVNMFATYSVAKHLSNSIPLFVAKQETDSKAGGTRFDTGYRETIASVAREYSRLRTYLETTLAAVGSSTSTSVRRNFFSVASPTSDPIAGT
jgi:hypothetical protein